MTLYWAYSIQTISAMAVVYRARSRIANVFYINL